MSKERCSDSDQGSLSIRRAQIGAAKRPWVKPTVSAVDRISRTASGPIRQTNYAEGSWYNPSP